MRTTQLRRLTTFFSGEDFFHHVVKANSYGSLVHLEFMLYLSILYEEEIKPIKKRKRGSIYNNI